MNQSKSCEEAGGTQNIVSLLTKGSQLYASRETSVRKQCATTTNSKVFFRPSDGRRGWGEVLGNLAN